MAVDAGPGPEQEKAELEKWEADAFELITTVLTHPREQRLLSNAVRAVVRPLPKSVIDKFQGKAREMWRTVT